MVHPTDDVKHKLKAGFDWHYNRYFAPRRHRTFMSILLIIIALFAWLMVKLALIDISVREVPFPIYHNNSLTSFPHIKKLSGSSQDINRTISEYLISQYITERETYSRNIFEEEAWNALQKKLQGFSSRQVYSDYVSHISSNNPNSPYFLYLRNRVRKVEIKNIALNKNNSAAIVEFETTDTDRDLNIKQSYIARIEYFIADATQVYNGNTKFQFLITDYKIIENNT